MFKENPAAGAETTNTTRSNCSGKEGKKKNPFLFQVITASKHKYTAVLVYEMEKVTFPAYLEEHKLHPKTSVFVVN